ncbi:MAG: hypothetical protein R3F59_19790 [Myxococcota bacterium]
MSVAMTRSGMARVKSAVPPLDSSMGTKAATVVPVAVPSGTASSATARRVASAGARPSSRWRCTASATTMALSTSRPSDRTRAATEIWCSTPPPTAYTATADSATSGTTEATTAPSRGPIETSRNPATISTPSTSERDSSPRRRSTCSGWNEKRSTCSGATVAAASSTAAATRSPKATRSCGSVGTTARPTAGAPSRKTRSAAGVCGSTATSASSPSGTAAPPGRVMGVARKAARSDSSALGWSTALRPSTSSVPPGATALRACQGGGHAAGVEAEPVGQRRGRGARRAARRRSTADPLDPRRAGHLQQPVLDRAGGRAQREAGRCR